MSTQKKGRNGDNRAASNQENQQADHNTIRITTLATILANNSGISAKTQRRRLALALEALGSITTFECMRFLDIYDPRPRKLELLADGYNIKTVKESAETESGETHKIGRYVLVGWTEGATA